MVKDARLIDILVDQISTILMLEVVCCRTEECHKRCEMLRIEFDTINKKKRKKENEHYGHRRISRCSKLSSFISVPVAM